MKKIGIIVIVTFVLLLLLFVTWQISKSRTFQFFGNIINQVETKEKVVALTFDDGPTDKTEDILRILDNLDVKATFFVTGNELYKNINIGKQIIDNGHELGNHSYSHSQMILKPLSFIKEEIKKTDILIRKTGYKGNIHFRPPFCKKLILLPYYLSKINKKTITWNIEPETYPDVAQSSKKIIKHVTEHIKPGSIILLHVMYDSRIESVNSIKGIVRSLRNKGYSFKTVSELLAYKKNK